MSRAGTPAKEIRLRHLDWAGNGGLALAEDHPRMVRYASQGYAVWNPATANLPGRWTITKNGRLATKREPSA